MVVCVKCICTVLSTHSIHPTDITSRCICRELSASILLSFDRNSKSVSTLYFWFPFHPMLSLSLSLLHALYTAQTHVGGAVNRSNQRMSGNSPNKNAQIIYSTISANKTNIKKANMEIEYKEHTTNVLQLREVE